MKSGFWKSEWFLGVMAVAVLVLALSRSSEMLCGETQVDIQL